LIARENIKNKIAKRQEALGTRLGNWIYEMACL